MIAVEQQGHGRTADIDRPLSFTQEADDTAGLLKQLGVETANVFGYSDGGNVGWGLAIRYPKLVGRLVVAGTNTNNDGLQPGILDIVKVYAELDPAATAARMPAALRDAYVKVAPRPQDWPTLVSKVMKQGVAFTGWRPEELKAVKAPVIVVIGDADIVRPEHAVENHRLIPQAQLAVLGHGPLHAVRKRLAPVHDRDVPRHACAQTKMIAGSINPVTATTSCRPGGPRSD